MIRTVALAFLLSAQVSAQVIQPPVAERRPHVQTFHGEQLHDDWFWLKDQGYPKVTDPDVLNYLKAENAYYEAAMAPHAKLTETLFEELQGRGEALTLAEVRRDLLERDATDRDRAHAPLVAAVDAILLDTTARPVEEVVATIVIAALAAENCS